MRPGFRWISRIGLAAVAVALFCAAAVLFFPAAPARLALRRFAAPRGWDVRFDGLRGSPLSSYRMTGISIDGPGIRLQARSLTVDMGWAALMKKNVVIAGGVEGGSMTVTGLPPKFPSTATGIAASFSWSGNQLRVPSLEMEAAGHRIKARGDFSPEALRWNVAAALSGELRGTVDSKGSTASWTAEGRLSWHEARGTFAVESGEDLLWRAAVESDRLPAARLAPGLAPLGLITGTIEARGRGTRPESLVADGRAGLTCSAGAATALSFRAERGVVTWKGDVEGFSLRAALDGKWTTAAKTFRARVRGDGAGKILAGWTDLEAERLRWDAEAHGTVSSPVWRFDASYEKLKARGINSGRGRIYAEGKGLPPSAEGKLEAEVHDTSAAGRRVDAARLTLEGGTAGHRFTIAGTSDATSIDGSGRGRYQDGGWRAEWDGLRIRWRDSSRAAGPFTIMASPGSFSVRGFTLRDDKGSLGVDGDFRADTLRVRLRADRFDPSFLLEEMSGAKVENAALDADVTLTRGRALKAEGEVRFSADRARLPALALDFRTILLVLHGEGGRLVIQQGTAVTKKGKAGLSGSVTAAGPEVVFRGERLAFRMENLAGDLDVDLALKGGWGGPRLTGSVFLHKAEYKPPKSSLLPKKDKRERPPPLKQPPPQPSPLSLDVAIRADRNVWYRQGNTALEFKADLKAEKEAYAPLRLYGTVETVRGDYFFYGRRFNIQSGSVLLTGEAPPNPVLSIQALHQAGDIDVTLSVGGTLDKPDVRLSSNPPLEEADILSVLATGHPVDATAGRAESDSRAAETAAQGMVAGYLSGKIQERLQRRVPLDVLRLNVQETGAAALTVGKNVTERLYVALEQTLGSEGASRVRSEYVLTRWLNLEGSSMGQGKYVIDLLFKFGFK